MPANPYVPNEKVAEVGETIQVTGSDGSSKESLEVVNVRSGDEIQPGSLIIEVKEVKT